MHRPLLPSNAKLKVSNKEIEIIDPNGLQEIANVIIETA